MCRCGQPPQCVLLATPVRHIVGVVVARREEYAVTIVKSVLGRTWRGIRRLRDLWSDEDLADAQAHRSDEHEIKPNYGIGFPMPGGGGGGI